MVAKQITLVLALALFPLSSYSITVKTEMKSYVLVEKAGLHLSKTCKNCEASKATKSLSAANVKQLLDSQKDKRVEPGVRLCQALGGLTYVGTDEKKQEWSVCEFKDGSALLCDDLSGVIRKFQE